LISWKYSFNRLNEEYDIAKRKQQALDKLYVSGRISQSTRDSFDNELVSAIADIEKQQKDLLTKMESKVSELRSQIQTLEMLLANYEIQHVVGEIDEETYQHEITLLSTGLDTAKHELDVIKEAATQLCPPPATAPAAPAIATIPEVTAPMPEAVAPPAPEPVTVPTPPVETIPAQPVEVEAPPAPAEVETPLICPQEQAQAAPPPALEPMAVENPPEAVVEAAPEAPTVTVEAVIEPKIEAPAETPLETITEPPTETVAETTETTAGSPTETTTEPQIETPAETPIEIIVEAPQEEASSPIETIAPENPKPVEEVIIEAHPQEAPKEAHPEIIVAPATEQTENAEESQQPAAEASSEENSKKENS
jgi:hypothetical protein